MSNAKPTVVVTEVDRKAAAEAFRWRTCDSAVSEWIETGNGASGVGGHAPGVAHAIAHARTMAAFEERCAAVKRVMRELPRDLRSVAMEHVLCIYAGVFAELAKVLFDDALIFLCGPRADDDIRALVLRGWEQ